MRFFERKKDFLRCLRSGRPAWVSVLMNEYMLLAVGGLALPGAYKSSYTPQAGTRVRSWSHSIVRGDVDVFAWHGLSLGRGYGSSIRRHWNSRCSDIGHSVKGIQKCFETIITRHIQEWFPTKLYSTIRKCPT